MPLAVDRTRLYVRGAAEALAETLWPTRCAVCDAPGEVLCDACRSALPYLDWWRACPVCGAPFGRVQCSECNPVVLGRAGRDTVPYDGCASAVTFGEAPARIVRTYKDQGERRLAEPLACLMARARPPSWRPEAVTFVPATSAARRRRGFDHAELLARGLAIPQDVRLAGFDNVLSSISLPFGLTSISADKGEEARRTVEMLLRRMETPDAPIARAVLDVRLVERESSR